MEGPLQEPLAERLSSTENDTSRDHASTTEVLWAKRLTICSTGLSGPSRARLAEAVESFGGRYSPSLKRGCTHLLVGPTVSGGQKPSPKLDHAGRVQHKWRLSILSMAWWDSCVQSSVLTEEAGHALSTTKIKAAQSRRPLEPLEPNSNLQSQRLVGSITHEVPSSPPRASKSLVAKQPPASSRPLGFGKSDSDSSQRQRPWREPPPKFCSPRRAGPMPQALAQPPQVHRRDVSELATALAAARFEAPKAAAPSRGSCQAGREAKGTQAEVGDLAKALAALRCKQPATSAPQQQSQGSFSGSTADNQAPPAIKQHSGRPLADVAVEDRAVSSCTQASRQPPAPTLAGAPLPGALPASGTQDLVAALLRLRHPVSTPTTPVASTDVPADISKLGDALKAGAGRPGQDTAQEQVSAGVSVGLHAPGAGSRGVAVEASCAGATCLGAVQGKQAGDLLASPPAAADSQSPSDTCMSVAETTSPASTVAAASPADGSRPEAARLGTPVQPKAGQPAGSVAVGSRTGALAEALLRASHGKSPTDGNRPTVTALAAVPPSAPQEVLPSSSLAEALQRSRAQTSQPEPPARPTAATGGHPSTALASALMKARQTLQVGSKEFARGADEGSPAELLATASNQRADVSSLAEALSKTRIHRVQAGASAGAQDVGRAGGVDSHPGQADSQRRPSAGADVQTLARALRTQAKAKSPTLTAQSASRPSGGDTAGPTAIKTLAQQLAERRAGGRVDIPEAGAAAAAAAAAAAPSAGVSTASELAARLAERRTRSSRDFLAVPGASASGGIDGAMETIESFLSPVMPSSLSLAERLRQAKETRQCAGRQTAANQTYNGPQETRQTPQKSEAEGSGRSMDSASLASALLRSKSALNQAVPPSPGSPDLLAGQQGDMPSEGNETEAEQPHFEPALVSSPVLLSSVVASPTWDMLHKVVPDDCDVPDIVYGCSDDLVSPSAHGTPEAAPTCQTPTTQGTFEFARGAVTDTPAGNETPKLQTRMPAGQNTAGSPLVLPSRALSLTTPVQPLVAAPGWKPWNDSPTEGAKEGSPGGANVNCTPEEHVSGTPGVDVVPDTPGVEMSPLVLRPQFLAKLSGSAAPGGADTADPPAPASLSPIQVMHQSSVCSRVGPEKRRSPVTEAETANDTKRQKIDSQMAQQGVFAGVVAVFDPELGEQEIRELRHAVLDGSGREAPGAFLGSGATHVVCPPARAANWLSSRLHVVSAEWVKRTHESGRPQRCVQMSLDVQRALPSTKELQPPLGAQVEASATGTMPPRTGQGADGLNALRTSREAREALLSGVSDAPVASRLYTGQARTPAQILDGVDWVVTEALDPSALLEGQSPVSLTDIVFRAATITILLPQDRNGALGHASRMLHLPREGLSASGLMSHVLEFYQEELELDELVQVMKSIPESSRCGRHLRQAFLDLKFVKRAELLENRCCSDGLFKVSSDPAGTIYELRLTG